MQLETREVYLLKRRKLGITLEQVAKVFDIHKGTASRWETGKLKMPKKYMKWIDRLAAEME
jgi:transcriptional regulator with XRE-family HTH domain